MRDDNYHQVLDALRDVRAANREGDAERIDEIVAMELGSSSEEEAEEAEEETEEEAEEEAEEEDAPIAA